MRRNTKLALSMCGAAAAIGLVANTALGAAEPQNFVLVSNHDIGAGKPSVHILQYAADGTVIGKSDPQSGTHYWYVNANTAVLTVSKDGRTFRIPETGTLVQNTDLPACFRVSNSGQLHRIVNEPCNTNGASEGTWN